MYINVRLLPTCIRENWNMRPLGIVTIVKYLSTFFDGVDRPNGVG